MLALLAVALVQGVVRMALAEIPPAPAHPRVQPNLSRMSPFSVCRLELQHADVFGQFGSAGFSRSLTWHSTTAGLLIRHPGGAVLIDAGSSSRTADELAGYPFLDKLVLTQAFEGAGPLTSASAALKAVGQEPSALSYLLPTHAHFDHLGGLMDLPGVAVRLPQEELDFIASLKGQPSLFVVPAHAQALSARSAPLRFDGGAYETFDESADLFGDGSVVVVKLPGHTPGHVGAFVNLSADARFFFVGDTVDHSEGFQRRVGKSFLLASSDFDRAKADSSVAKVAQLHELVPSLTIIPAHDRDAWERAFGPSSPCLERKL